MAADKDGLEQELSGLLSWFVLVGGMIVKERQAGVVHVYRGSIHTQEPFADGGDAGVCALVKALRAAKVKHET